MTELLPCPFCNFEAEWIQHEACNYASCFLIYPQCTNEDCGCRLGGVITADVVQCKENMAESWNARYAKT